MDNIPNSVTIIVNLIIAAFVAIVAFRRSGYQNTVDDSQAAMNYKKMLNETRKETEEVRAELEQVKEMLEKAHLAVSLEIKMGGQPVVTAWKWKQEESTSR